MLKIRLQRVARKHIPIFRVVLTDSRNSTKSGKFHEVLGSFNLMTDEKKVNAERVKYWMSKGAQPSGTVHNFLLDQKIIEGKKINVLPKKRPVKKTDQPAQPPGAVQSGEQPTTNDQPQEKKEETTAETAPEAKTETAPIAEAAPAEN